MKKNLFFLLTLLFALICIVPQTAYAEDSLFTYELKEDNTANPAFCSQDGVLY